MTAGIGPERLDRIVAGCVAAEVDAVRRGLAVVRIELVEADRFIDRSHDREGPRQPIPIREILGRPVVPIDKGQHQDSVAIIGNPEHPALAWPEERVSI